MFYFQIQLFLNKELFFHNYNNRRTIEKMQLFFLFIRDVDVTFLCLYNNEYWCLLCSC